MPQVHALRYEAQDLYMHHKVNMGGRRGGGAGGPDGGGGIMQSALTCRTASVRNMLWKQLCHEHQSLFEVVPQDQRKQSKVEKDSRHNQKMPRYGKNAEWERTEHDKL